jgi:hypothetical protein
MGRPKGSRNRPKNGAEHDGEQGAAPEAGHNGPPPAELTEDEQRALFFQNKRHYSTALEAKKAADAAFKHVCKRAKSECGPDAVADIKDAIAFEAPEGKVLFSAEIERKRRVARWLGLAVGEQPSFFDEDRAPQDEREYEAGKQAGMAGVTCIVPPGTRDEQVWIRGWQEGQAVLMSAIGKMGPAD